ncbi:hypothetical protein FGIG_02395 [Fasciola gigantica]|uniref:Uncharacterized protein n=1 Tax=Fasciola gigantica TaxID=46835 RepID=A0A504Z276_FASGI|nr:hypothetical protein FGIG_02395 [Fasciola gigantica]
MAYLWEHRVFICLFCSLCLSHMQTSKDERQSPFWSSIVFLNSPGFNLQTPVADIEQKMTKSFTIAMAYRGFNYSSDFNVSLKVHTVKVVELRSLQNHGQQEIIFLVQKKHEYNSPSFLESSSFTNPELRNKSTQYAEVQASAAQTDVSIFVTTNELLDEQHVTFQNSDRIQAHASETTATSSTKVNAKQKMRKDPVVEKMVSPIKEDRKEETQCMTIKSDNTVLEVSNGEKVVYL